MALTNYTTLQTAVITELDRTGNTEFTTAVPDFITRAEAKMNRVLRLREMEDVTTDTYSAATSSYADRSMSLPARYIELLNLEHKVATADDTTYEPVIFVAPADMPKYYTTSSAGDLYYTLRDAIEYSHAVGVDHTIRFHYLKKLDIATDTTNWLLTNYPDAYLYGALVEASVFIVDDQRAVGWLALFKAAMEDLQSLSERGRDDSQLDTSEIAGMSDRSTFNILRG
ncbi:MAG: hypothetical protein WBN07_12055 [Woeseiaceae bacterium]